MLRGLPSYPDENVLVGYDHFDDAGVYRLTNELAVVNTMDFFPPIVDDPYVFGQVAATNALSDIYAMGARAITAMNIVCFPVGELPFEVLGKILEGGLSKVHEAGAASLGGHSVDDKELKYGLSVTGVIHPKRILTNSAAKPGDSIVLSKPLGVGILTTAVKLRKAKEDVLTLAIESMTTLNRSGAEVSLEYGARSATDITGFGLLGHGSEMARGSGVRIRIRAEAVPVLPRTIELAERKIETMAYKANKENLGGFVQFKPSVPKALERIFMEAETSGGLFVSFPAEKAESAAEAMRKRGLKAAVIGEVLEGQGIEIV